MNPPRITAVELVKRYGEGVCRPYLAAIEGFDADWLEARRLDPESIYILNYEVRHTSHPPSGVGPSRLYLAEDGCGNYFFVDGDDSNDSVKFDCHDPPGIEDTGLAVVDWLSVVGSELEPSNVVGADSLVICRTEQIHRSALAPIELEELRAAVAGLSQVECPGYLSGVNPFTGREERYESSDSVLVTVGDQAFFGWLSSGRLEFSNATDALVPIAGELADRLRARVHFSTSIE
jgi:hypothetical protein